jgi:phosphoglycerate dehydrogenase-like enzyme
MNRNGVEATAQVVCLRPLEDFLRVGVRPPEELAVAYVPPDGPELAEEVAQAEAVVLPSVGPPVATDLLVRAVRLKLVQFTGAGVDRVDVGALARRGVPVAHVAGANAREVAEYVVIAAGVVLRRLAWADREIRRGRYREVRSRMLADNLPGFSGLSVGIVGLGHIGVAVARAFSRLGCRVAYYDPLVPTPPDEAGAIERLSLHELMAVSDIVTLHVPLTPATRMLIDAEALSRMRPGAVLVQASRGGVVDEAALAARLRDGALAGAAVDVYADEPPDAHSPLLSLTGEAAERVLFTPHVAGVTRQSTARLSRAAWDNVYRVIVGGLPPLNVAAPP